MLDSKYIVTKNDMLRHLNYIRQEIEEPEALPLGPGLSKDFIPDHLQSAIILVKDTIVTYSSKDVLSPR